MEGAGGRGDGAPRRKWELVFSAARRGAPAGLSRASLNLPRAKPFWVGCRLH